MVVVVAGSLTASRGDWGLDRRGHWYEVARLINVPIGDVDADAACQGRDWCLVTWIWVTPGPTMDTGGDDG